MRRRRYVVRRRKIRRRRRRGRPRVITIKRLLGRGVSIGVSHIRITIV